MRVTQYASARPYIAPSIWRLPAHDLTCHGSRCRLEPLIRCLANHNLPSCAGPMIEVPRLYKYMSLERLLDLLKVPTIRFTQPEALNDPYECHLTLDRHEVAADYRHFRRSQSPEMSAEALEKSVASLEDTLVMDALHRYRELRANFGLVSLSEDPLQLLMWAHYGCEHKGVAVELDLMHPTLRPGSPGGDVYSDLRKVQYTQKKIVGIPSRSKIIEVLCTKSPDWSYEREWRLIRTLNLTRQAKPGVHVVDFDLSAIRTIYLGANFNPTKLEELADLVAAAPRPGPSIYQVELVPHSFALRAVDIKQYGWKLLHRSHHFGEVAREALTCLPMDDD